MANRRRSIKSRRRSRKNQNKALTTTVVILLYVVIAACILMVIMGQVTKDKKLPDETKDIQVTDINNVEAADKNAEGTDMTMGENELPPVENNTEAATETKAEEPEKEIETETTKESEEEPEEKETEPKETQSSGHVTSAYDPSAWNLILVNPWNPLPDNFTPNLVYYGNIQVDARAYDDLAAMMADCKAAGNSPMILQSAYRTYSYQQNLHKKQINKYLNMGYSQDAAYTEASKWVAVPGTSEHHTGLAADIVASYNTTLDESQENTKEQKWLMANSYKYGWILRFPKGTTDITGIYYEPWHYRYVGKEVAAEIYSRGITFEEYIQSIK